MKLLEVETFNFRKKKGIKGYDKPVFFYQAQIILAKPKTCPCSLHEDPHVQVLRNDIRLLVVV